MNFDVIPDNCFISHSYKDNDALNKLLKSLPARVKSTIFNPIKVTPDEMVSSQLIKCLLDCDGLIYLKGGKSNDSFWVAFERNYAFFARKPVFCFNISSETIDIDNSCPRRPPVYASYRHGKVGHSVEQILNFISEYRHFDIFKDDISPGNLFEEQLINGLKSRLDDGGYVILFCSASAISSLWMKKEIEIVNTHPNAFNHTIVAVLDETGFKILQETAPQFIKSNQVVQLYKKDNIVPYTKRTKLLPNGLNQNKLDDLIVLIYWLFYCNETNTFLNERFPVLPERPRPNIPLWNS